MNKIELKFDKTITRLAGNEFGYNTYKEQVEKNVDWNNLNEIIFPKEIDRIAISFIQGFARDILKKIDKNNIEEIFIFNTSNKELAEKIINNIKF